jgi:hypothetical protein
MTCFKPMLQGMIGSWNLATNMTTLKTKPHKFLKDKEKKKKRIHLTLSVTFFISSVTKYLWELWIPGANLHTRVGKNVFAPEKKSDCELPRTYFIFTFYSHPKCTKLGNKNSFFIPNKIKKIIGYFNPLRWVTLTGWGAFNFNPAKMHLFLL